MYLPHSPLMEERANPGEGAPSGLKGWISSRGATGDFQMRRGRKEAFLIILTKLGVSGGLLKLGF